MLSQDLFKEESDIDAQNKFRDRISETSISLSPLIKSYPATNNAVVCYIAPIYNSMQTGNRAMLLRKRREATVPNKHWYRLLPAVIYDVANVKHNAILDSLSISNHEPKSLKGHCYNIMDEDDHHLFYWSCSISRSIGHYQLRGRNDESLWS